MTASLLHARAEYKFEKKNPYITYPCPLDVGPLPHRQISIRFSSLTINTLLLLLHLSMPTAIAGLDKQIAGATIHMLHLATGSRSSI